VVIEDRFYSANPYSLLYVSAVFSRYVTIPAIGNYIPARPYETTMLIVDEKESQLNHRNRAEEPLPGVPALVSYTSPYPLPASYAQIKKALQSIDLA
jgi:hypothetical protein